MKRQDLRLSPLLPQGEGRDEGIEKENVLILIPLTLTLSLRAYLCPQIKKMSKNQQYPEKTGR
jgi:hypothetical protein